VQGHLGRACDTFDSVAMAGHIIRAVRAVDLVHVQRAVLTITRSTQRRRGTRLHVAHDGQAIVAVPAFHTRSGTRARAMAIGVPHGRPLGDEPPWSVDLENRTAMRIGLAISA
jgi:hypothetical protein